MHLICHCSICGNKCGRLSDSVPSRHVSSPLPAPSASGFPLLHSFFYSHCCSVVSVVSSQLLPHSLLLSQHGPFPLSTALLISSLLLTTLIIRRSSRQITTLSNSFLSVFCQIASPPARSPSVYPACLLVLFCSSLSPANLAPCLLLFSAVV